MYRPESLFVTLMKRNLASLVVQFEQSDEWKARWPSPADVLKSLRYSPATFVDSPDSLADWLQYLDHMNEWVAWCGWRLDERVGTHKPDLTTLIFLCLMERKTEEFYRLVAPIRLVPQALAVDLTSIKHAGRLIQRFEVDELEGAELHAYRTSVKKDEPRDFVTRQVARSAAIIRFIRRQINGCKKTAPNIPVEFTNTQGRKVTSDLVERLANQPNLHVDESFAELTTEYLFGTHLRLGERVVYASTNPVPLDDSLTPSSLVKADLSPDQVRSILKPDEKTKHGTEDQVEVTQLMRFAYWFQTTSSKRTSFLEKYFIGWHQWCTDREFELLQTQRRSCRQRLPILCHCGRKCWIIFGLDFYLVYEEVVAALFAWLFLTTNEQSANQGEDEFGSLIPDPAGPKRPHLR